LSRTAIYAGSFDPITMGHVDIIQRGCTLFDRVVVAVGHNPNKRSLLDLETRLQVIRESTDELPQVEVRHFSGLLVDLCREVGAVAILRGLRAVTDFEFEFKIGLANMDMAPEVQTVFLLTGPHRLFISSSLVREIAGLGGDVTRYVPPAAHAALARAGALGVRGG
jgi:pantetheine-phosphate adenylyltransferase